MQTNVSHKFFVVVGISSNCDSLNLGQLYWRNTTERDMPLSHCVVNATISLFVVMQQRDCSFLWSLIMKSWLIVRSDAIKLNLEKCSQVLTGFIGYP